MRNKKGLSLVETLTSIAILSILIGVMVQIILFYNRVQRETGSLTTATLDAKEIGIKIERYMLQSKYIQTEKRDIPTGGYIYIIKCLNEYSLTDSEIWYINNYLNKYNDTIIYDNLLNTKVQKQLPKEIYMVLNDYNNKSPQVIEISFYVYNKYAKKYRNINTKILAYYISIIKYSKLN